MEIGPDKMLPIPLANAKAEKMTGGSRGSSFEIIVMSWFHTAVKLRKQWYSVSHSVTAYMR